MSVIVLGMEMPKKAMFAAIFPPDDEHGTWYISVVEGKGKTADYVLTPLPEKHGRLIDAEALRARFPEPNHENGGWLNPEEACIHKTGVWAEICSAPVIVEAEGD